MKLTYREILEAHRAITALTENGSILVPARAALRLARAAQKLTVEVQTFERTRIAIVKRVSNGNNENGFPVVPPDRVAEFTREMESISAEELELEIEPISLEAFRETAIPLAAFVGMEWLIQE